MDTIHPGLTPPADGSNPLPPDIAFPADPEGRFEGLPLNTDYIDGVYSRLARDVAYASPAHGTTTIRAGFVFDWASVPWVFRRIMPRQGARRQPYGIAALFHDWLYQHQKIAGKPITRATADAVFYEISEYLGVARWRRWMKYRAVRLGGWLPWRRHARRKMEGETQRREEREGEAQS